MNYLPEPTVREYFQTQLLAECQSELKPSTIKEIRTALNHWERCTDNPSVPRVSAEHARQLRDTLLISGMAPATVKKTWAHLSTIFRAAVYDSLLIAVPQAGRLRKSILPKAVRHTRAPQRRPITPDELARLFHGCTHATYPRSPHCCRQWQVLLYLFWTYGCRTRDAFALTVADILPSELVISFTAMKTNKLQGLPLTPFGLSLLQQLADGRPGTAKLFPRFVKAGNWNRPQNGTGSPHWISGFYATWNAEICPAAGVIPHCGPPELIARVAAEPTAVQPIQLKTLRQTMVTELNDYSKRVHSCRQLGAWVAGHYLPGVTAQNYDYPEQDVRDAVLIRENELLPECFRTLLLSKELT